jgi:hypothetical protein
MGTMKTVMPAMILLLVPLQLAVADDRIKRLSQALDENPSPESLLPLLPELDALMRDETAAAAALPVAERIAAALLPTSAKTGLWPTEASLLKLVARMRFEQAEPEKATKHLEALLEMYRAVFELSGNRAAAQQAQWSSQVALEYLRGGQTKAAFDLIGNLADRPLTNFEPTQVAVAGAMNRRLQELSTDDRYELLYAWTMPTRERKNLRVFASLAPIEAPPDVFARALGERPRANAFPVPEVGGVPGLFSTAWLLVQSAASTGRLRRLTTELSELRNAKVPHADHLWLLARIADQASDATVLHKELSNRLAATELTAARPNTAGAAPAGGNSATQSALLQWSVIAAACLAGESSASPQSTINPQRSAMAQAVCTALLDPKSTATPDYLRKFARRAQAVGILRQHEGIAQNLLDNPDLKFWIPASEAASTATEYVRPVWLEHESHILHLAGQNHDFLCFRYPLVGTFEFHLEAQNGGPEHTFGSLAFGGLSYGIAGNADELRVWGMDMGRMTTRRFPFVRKERWPVYQRVVLRSSADSAQLVVNGHPIWTDPLATTTSPWLALRAFGQYVPVFRSFRLEGSPTIPHEVRLSDGNVLRGWLAQFYPSRTPNVVPSTPATPAPAAGPSIAPSSNLLTTVGRLLGVPMVANPPTPPPFDWEIRDGVIHGTQSTSLFAPAVQGRLAYFRPLQNEESISYEFLYEPGRYAVHPALGRLAFLIEPGGVRVHWMTGVDQEWTGLSEDNATIEPLNRRGPRPLPLKAGEWNRVTMSLQNNTVTLALNEATIYERKIAASGNLPFSFYCDRSRSAVQVRNVLLRGNWPEQFSEQDLANLAARRQTAGAVPEKATRQALGQLFAERHMNDSVLAVHWQGQGLSPEKRFEMLSNFVLPGLDHENFRLALDFTPTNPAPVGVNSAPLQEVGSRLESGGELISPAFDLVAVAAQLDRLAEIRQRIDAVPPSSDLVRRQRLALLVLVDIAAKNFQSANDLLFQVFQMVEQGTHTSFAERWPETLALHAALRQPETRGVARELAYYLHLRQARSGPESGSEAWRRQVSAWAGLARYLDGSANRSLTDFAAAPPLKQWTPVSRASAHTYGSGFPRAHWQRVSEGIEAQAGHAADYLFFQSPLAGNYEVECETPPFGWRDTQIMVAGEWAAARHDLKSYAHGDFRKLLAYHEVSPPFKRPADWIHYRVVVRNAAARYYANGRLTHERAIELHSDPWLAIRSDDRSDGGVRYVRITGTPEIPDQIQLAGSEDLRGWAPYYDSHTVGASGSNTTWKQLGNLDEGGGIVGQRNAQLAGTFAESLLRYHRPMLEDGTIEYEFFYRGGQIHCHPALDRLVFLLEPTGIRIHWLTDGAFDRTDLAPDNAVEEPQHRRGLAAVSLLENAWNRLSLKLQGSVVRLSLNGELAYERPLEPTNLRSFGLFHYADQSEAQVRRITWRGGWPRTLPSLSEQELAGNSPAQLDEQRNKLAAAFEHDFASEGFPSNKFSILYGKPGESFRPKADGLHIDHRGAQGYRNAMFTSLLDMHGDFDVIATYDQIVTEATFDGSASVFLQASLDNAQQTECAVSRRQTNDKVDTDQQFHQTVVVNKTPAGDRRSYSRAMPNEAVAGSLRLARRGETVHFLIADGDSTQFRLVRSEEVGDERISSGNLKLYSQTSGPGRMFVVWKSISIRAEKLTGIATEDPLKLVASLDRQRAALASRLMHDFARDRIAPDQFYAWGFRPPASPQAGGLRVAGPPNDNWTSAGIDAKVALPADFDVSLEFDVLKMSPPQEGLASGVYLQIEFAEPDARQFSLIFNGMPDGTKNVLAQSRVRVASGALNYPSHGRVFIDEVKRLRVARRGRELHFLFAADLSSADKPLARIDLPPDIQAPATVKLLVHTGGKTAVTEAGFKKLILYSQ